MPEKPSALGALKKRPYTPRPVQQPQDIWDVDALLGDTKDFLGEMPEGTGSQENITRLNTLLADMDAGELSREQMMRERGPNVGAVGAVADSLATPIRVVSGFLPPVGAGVGEAIAGGLESIAYLDGKPLPAGGSFGKDVAKTLGKVGTAGVFGKLGQGIGPLSALAKRAGTSLATRIGVGAAAGATEGAALNVAQGGLTRAFDAGSIDAAFDKDGALLDLGLGAGIGAAGGGALSAMDALAARAATPTRWSGPMPENMRVDADGRTVVTPRAPWQDATDAAFDAHGSGWVNGGQRPANGGLANVRGPAVRQRVAPTSSEIKGLLPPASSTQLGASPSRFDVIEPNDYQGPANPTGMPPGVPEPRGLDAPPTPEELAALSVQQADAAQAAMLPQPAGPELPRGRYAADSPTAAAAEPFVPGPAYPVIDEMKRMAMLETPPTLDELNAVTFREMADPSADVSMQRPPAGPAVAEPFDVPVMPIRDAGFRQTFGTPTRMTSDGQRVSIYFAGKDTPFVVPVDALAQVSPELDAVASRFRRQPPQGDPRLTITPRPGRPTPEAPARPAIGPNEADLVALSNERALADVDEYDPFVEGDLERMLGGMDEVSPGVIAEPGTTFAPDPTPPLAVAADETAEFTDDQLAALLRQADEQDALEANTGANSLQEEPSVEVLDPDAESIRNNASGDSSASVEAMNRQASMKAKGESFVMLDRAGRETPLIGTDAVDQVPGRGQTKAIKKADGSYEVVQDNGGRIPPTAGMRAATPPPAPGPEATPPMDLADAQDDELMRLLRRGDDFREPPASPEPTPVPRRPPPSGPGAPGGAMATPELPPAPEAPAAAPAADAGLTLNDGDQPGTMNQAGKFVPISDDSWRTLEPAKNKSVVIRRADGTVTMVRDNGGKVPKKWDAQKWAIKQEQARLKAEAKAAREAERAAKKAAAGASSEPQTAAAGQESPSSDAPPVAAEYEPPMTAEEASGDALPPGSRTVPEPAPAPAATVRPRSIEKTKFGDRDAVEMAFDTKPSDEVRKALGEYGFRYFARDRKWAFNIPKGSKITPDEVESAVEAILRGESVESVQKAINLDAGQQKAAANAVKEGRWAPDPSATVLKDRDLSPDAAEREVRRTALRQLGWEPGVEGNRRVWKKPADGMRGDMGLRESGPEAPTPPNPPRAEAPSVPSATAAAEIATGRSGDYTKVDPLEVKVDPKAYQFKTGGDVRGRNEKLKGVEEWDPMQGKLSPVLLHRRLDGSVYVVDGHQRVGIAQDLKRAGKDVPDLNAIMLDEADGVTVAQARRAGAMANVMHNTADPMDIARVLREGELSPLESKRIGRMASEAGEKFKIGRDLATLDDKAFDYLRDSQIDPKYARLVSQYRPEMQEPLLQQLDRMKPRTYSEAESILSHAAEMKSAGVQTDMFGNTTVDDSFKELVQFKERVLSSFRTNRRLFGKAGSAADRLETAGSTKIDREAAGKVASQAGRAEELWSKFANAQGSSTRTAIQEAFDDYRSNRISFGKATDRIAEALDADYAGRPLSRGDAGGGTGAGPLGEAPDDGPGLFAPEGGPGGLFDAGAVAEGAEGGGALEDAADAILDVARKFLKDERGSVNIGDGMAGLQELYTRNPRAFYAALRAGGGAFLGALTHDDEDASIIDNLLLGAAAGAASTRFSGAAWRALKKAAPIVHREVREALTGRVYGRGPINPRAVPMARKPPDVTKDISGFEKVFWSPDKVVPDVWAHIQPIMRSLYELEAPARGLTPDQLALARRSQVSEAMAYMRGSATKAKNDGHTRRAAYIEALMADLTGDPTVPEQFLSDMTNGRIKPKQIRKVMTASTNAIYHTLLGWNVGSGLANMTQAAFNYPVLGAKATAKGILRAYSKAGRQELKFLNLNRRPMGHSEEQAMHRWVEKYLDWSQSPMRFSDSGNRRATYAGAMEWGRARGFSEDQLKDFANELTGQTQGIAGDLGSNPFHRHLGPLRVFTKYPLIWGSWVQDMATHPDPAVKRRFYGMATGIFAASALSGIQLANFFIPRMGIVPGVGAGIDIGQHLFGAADHDFEEHAEIGGTEDKLTPGYLNKVASAASRFNEHGLGDRNIIGRKGQVLRSVSALEDLGSLLGIETTNRAEARKEESAMYDFATEAKRDESVRSRRIRREAGERLEAGDRAGASRALKALSERQRREFKKERLRTARERARRLVPLRRREEFDDQFPRER